MMLLEKNMKKGDGNLMFGTVDTWLIYHLTKKGICFRYHQCSRTYFMDLETLDYDDDLLDFWGLILQNQNAENCIFFRILWGICRTKIGQFGVP